MWIDQVRICSAYLILDVIFGNKFGIFAKDNGGGAGAYHMCTLLITRPFIRSNRQILSCILVMDWTGKPVQWLTLWMTTVVVAMTSKATRRKKALILKKCFFVYAISSYFLSTQKKKLDVHDAMVLKDNPIYYKRLAPFIPWWIPLPRQTNHFWWLHRLCNHL